MIKQQTILIAGATGNIGRAAAIALARRGARVVLLGRNSKKLESKVNGIRKELHEEGVTLQDPDIDYLVVDFANLASVQSAASEATQRYPEIHGLILSVGAFLQNGPTVLPNGHEVMFATNVIGPFMLTELLLKRMEKSDGLLLHVIAPFKKDIDWEDLESIKCQKPMTAFDRTKVMNRMIAGETARRYAGRIACVAFDPAYVIDKSDPELTYRWPSGFWGFIWRIMTVLFAKTPKIAGEPIADLMLEHPDRNSLNGAIFRLDKRLNKTDKDMNDMETGKRLWDALIQMIR